MAGSTPLHNAADIFPTGDPTVVAVAAALPCILEKKRDRETPLLPPSQPILLCFLLLCQASTVQQGSSSTRRVCFGESLGPGLIEINEHALVATLYLMHFEV